jgi:hypothetical protein
MTTAEKLDALRESPDYRRVTIGGVGREFCLGRYGMRLAREQGVDVLAAEKLPDMDGVAALLYAGCIPFMEPVESFDDFADLLSGRELLALAPLVNMQTVPTNGQTVGEAEGGIPSTL